MAVIIILMKRSISAISQFKENKNTANTNRSKSPQRLVNGVRLFNFSQIESYKHIHKPFLNQVKKEHIKHKLDLQKSTEARVTRRVKNNDMFICYNRNPFMPDRHSKSVSLMYLDDHSVRVSNKTIVEEINNLKSKKINRQIQSKQLNEIQYGAMNFSQLVQRQLKNSASSNTPFNKKWNNKSMIVLPPRQKQQVLLGFQNLMEFEQIIDIKEQKHIDKSQKNLNIFRLLYDKSMFNKNLTKLDKYFFSFNSLFEKFQKYKTQIYRDLSRESRFNVSKKPEGKPKDNFDTFTPTELNFNDLINVAAGRFTPEIVYHQLNMDRAPDNASGSQISEEEIIYRDNLINRSTKAETQNQLIKEAEQFLRLALTKKEEKYKNLNIQKKQEIKAKMEKILKLVNFSIYDKKLHKQLRNQINSQLSLFANQSYKYPKSSMEKNNLVEKNKENKSKNEIIKLEQLIQTFQLAKHHDKQVKQLINKRI